MKNIERIAQVIENKAISIRAFEISIGASNGAFGRAIKNRTDISSEWLSIIVEKYPDLNAEWLLTGRGEMLNTAPASATPTATQIDFKLTDRLTSIIESQQRTIEALARGITEK